MPCGNVASSSTDVDIFRLAATPDYLLIAAAASVICLDSHDAAAAMICRCHVMIFRCHYLMPITLLLPLFCRCLIDTPLYFRCFAAPITPRHAATRRRRHLMLTRFAFSPCHEFHYAASAAISDMSACAQPCRLSL